MRTSTERMSVERSDGRRRPANRCKAAGMAITEAPPTTRTAHRTCPLCEATCGLEITIEDERVKVIRGDRADVFSAGYICPKGSTLKQLQEDPDRLRTPLVRRDGVLVEATWDEAFEEAGRLVQAVVAEHGHEAMAIYSGNPSAHNLAYATHTRALYQALRTRQRYSASTVDQMPKQVSAGLMFGTAISIPVPDVDRTDFLVVMGANPFESNGSLLSAPNLPGRLEAIVERGGTVVVIDPRRTRTADAASEHIAIRPGTDAFLLLAIVHVLFEEELVDLGPLEPHVEGVDAVRAAAEPYAPEVVAADCGCDAEVIRSLACRLAGAPSAAVYGRIGTCTQEFGTLASWLVDVVNVLPGNLDKPGGALFPRPLSGSPNTEGRPGTGRGIKVGSSTRTRVRGLPAILGEMPTACLAEEIDSPPSPDDANADAPPVRGIVVLAGNPVLSTQNSDRLDAALAGLDCVIAVDYYLNETTRHAHVLFPAPGPLEKPHFDVLLYRLAIRSVGNYSPPTFPLPDGMLPEWEVLLRLAAAVSGAPLAGGAALDDAYARGAVEAAVARPSSAIHGRDAEEILRMLEPRTGSERLLDLMLRTGPFGDAFGARPDGVTLAALEDEPHGIDLGPMEARVPEVLRTPSGRIELAPPPLLDDLDRLAAARGRFADGGTVLVGRRDLRSNNSWMHNVDVLVKGKLRCTLQVHPVDAARLGLADGADAEVRSRVGAVVAPVEITDIVMPGVVSLPHGWGHDQPGTRMAVAARRPGVNSNVLTDEQVVDPLSGNGVLNGIPVTVSPA
jgi:anaerobic selenocysteine-containing dehydrogenase